MVKKRILVVIGTRPEAIKLAPVCHALRKRRDLFEVKICVTGQHREMLYQAMEHFEIEPDFDLKLMERDQSLFGLSASLISNLDRVLDDFRPDMIIVQGDTTTAFVSGLAGYYNRIQVGHVEAGLRTSDKFAPFPEEMNRRLLTVLADHHFAPTEGAKEALLRENVTESSILVTGNTVIDALLFTLKKISHKPPTIEGLEAVLAGDQKIILVTGHRRENFGEGLKNICEAIRRIALEHEEVIFIYPVHLNPNVQGPVYSLLGEIPNVHLVPPLSYLPFVRLMSAAYIILTDSGGIQEEAPSLGIPVIVMRDKTERPEAVEAGAAVIAGSDRDTIMDKIATLITDRNRWEKMSKVRNPFGDGKAADRIVDYIEKII